MEKYSSWVLERAVIGECHRLRVGLNSVGRHSSSRIRILDSSYVSRHHAEVEVSLDDMAVTIKDLNSVNGVFVNNVLHKSVTVTLSKGDNIGIGVSGDCSEEEDELTLPIYELKYLPITRGKQLAAAPAQQSNNSKNTIKKENGMIPSTSRPSNNASAKQHVIEEILIISDDDDGDFGVGGVGSVGDDKQEKFVESKNKEKEIKSTAETSDIFIKKEKIENEQPKQLPADNKHKTAIPKDEGKSMPEDKKDYDRSIPGKINEIDEEKKPLPVYSKANESKCLPQVIDKKDKDSSLPENDKEQNHLHIPIISSIKKERIRSVSADVQNIFGDLDDDQKNKLKEISPLVYNDLNGKPLLPTTNEQHNILNGECITLISDDETPVDEEELGVIIPKSAEKPWKEKNPQAETSKSPNIFDMSLNDSIEDDNANALEVLKKHLDEKKTKEKPAASDNVDLEDYTSYEPQSDDDEEFMFSQVFINDMKAELKDDFNTDLDEDLPQPNNEDEQQLPIQIKQEPDLERNASLLNEMGNSCWVISDDEDYDEELETKVSDWSNKIFSQSFSYSNMSQVYDLDNDTDDEEEEEDGNDNEPNNDHDRVDFNIVDDDIDDIADLYNSNNDIQDNSVHEEIKCTNEESHALKAEVQLTLEANEKSVKDKVAPKVEDFKEANQVYVSTSKSINAPEDLREIDHTTGSTTISIKTPEKEEIFDALKNLINVKDVREKSPDIAIKKRETVDSDSPLIRTRRKSMTTCKPVTSSEDEDENEAVQENPATSAEQPSTITNHQKDKSIARPPPKIIDAPSLPKCKGKLRGVSAERSPQPTKHKKIPQKLNSIREQIRCEQINNDLKRKWTEKPSIGKKRDKERMKVIKECRKDKLKQLAEKRISPVKDNLKRKNSTDVDEEAKSKKAKVKVTAHNRGAFLAQNEPQTTTPKPKGNKPTAFKIPKVVNKKPEDAKKEPLQRSNSNDEIKKKEPLKRSSSVDCGFPTFSQEISKPDHLLTKKPETKTNSTNKRPATMPTTTTTAFYADTSGTICKEALAARALRTTNKITFASMEKNIIESEKNKSKLNSICNKRCSKLDNSMTSILLSSGCGSSMKKTVRFNATPIIHYIERVCGSRKVASKDILPMTTHKDRRHLIRRTYPIIDNTDKIISQILGWSDEWLIKRNAEMDAASDIVYPMPTHFSSFDHYKSILFPLMKLEFVSLLERQYNLALNIRKYKVTLEYVTVNLDRLMLVTKFNYQNRQHLDSSKYDLVILESNQMNTDMFAYLTSTRKGAVNYQNRQHLDSSKYDLVILESNQMNTDMFAYLTSTRKGAGSCNTMVFEILPKNITKEFFSGIKELTVRPVIDNVRVEFGAFNAVYQLEATPLYQKILNPLDLLQCRHPSRKKVIYRGFDTLNDKQRQVLLNTYVRIIDESTPTVSLLQGPPGTGKSCVIANLALQTMYGDEVRCMDKKILICAQSNAAVDVIAGKLYDISMRMRQERRFRLIRYGLPDKINPFVYPVTLQYITEQEQMKKLKASNPEIPLENKENLKNQMLQLEAQIADMSKRNIKGTVEEDMLLEKQRQLQLMRNISNQYTRPEDERSIVMWYLNNANIVCATLSSCVKLSQYVNYFDICIIDEATQCTEPWTLLPLRFGINALVLVGDTQQLPATILSKKANELGLGKSMFTRIQNCLDDVPCSTNGASSGTITPNYIISGLQTQYRMNPEICKWPNQYFYRNELINGRITMEYKTPLMPLSVLNLAYTQNEFCKNGKITNNLEAEFVAKLLKALDGFIPNKYNSYGVITPYAHHRTTLENSIRSLGLTNIMVNTIDSYQGLEKDVIVISNARTNGIGFLANPQRLNVALTRPKKCLILCGNFKNLEIVPAWRCLLQSARERNLYHEISTNCVNDIQTNVIDKIRIKK